MTTVSQPIHRPEQRATTSTVRDVTFDLLRECGLTTVFGNVGSTEEAFLENFPSDFRYVLGLQETSVIAMADGFAQATRRPALVNVHTAAGLGNAMGGLVTAYMNKTPLIVTAGQQTREMLLLEPWLTNVEPETLPRPWVKWDGRIVGCGSARPALSDRLLPGPPFAITRRGEQRS
jgi:benzoylformate decarboxylase